MLPLPYNRFKKDFSMLAILTQQYTLFICSRKVYFLTISKAPFQNSVYGLYSNYFSTFETIFEVGVINSFQNISYTLFSRSSMKTGHFLNFNHKLQRGFILITHKHTMKLCIFDFGTLLTLALSFPH